MREICIEDVDKHIDKCLKKNCGFEFDFLISILTLEKLEDINELIKRKGLVSKLTYNIIDNIYIKIRYQ